MSKALTGGGLLGVTIAAMHYDGVAGMRLPATIGISHEGVMASIAVGVAFSVLAFARATDLQSLRRKVEIAAYLGIAVLGVHFLGMSALQLFPGSEASIGGRTLGADSLAVAIGGISIAIIVSGMVSALTDQRLSAESQREAERLCQLAEASFEGIVFHCDGIIFNANETFAKLVGCSIDELKGHPAIDFVAPSGMLRVADKLNQAGPGGRVEFDIRAKDGRYIPVEVLSRQLEHKGRPAYVSAVRDLSERKKRRTL